MGPNMTRQQRAADIIRCWGLIERCQRVGFPIPRKWLKYGMPNKLRLFVLAYEASGGPERVNQILNQPCILWNRLAHR